VHGRTGKFISVSTAISIHYGYRVSRQQTTLPRCSNNVGIDNRLSYVNVRMSHVSKDLIIPKYTVNHLT